MNRRLIQFLIHLVGVMVFLALPYLLADDGLSKLSLLTTNAHERRNLLSYVLTAGFFYVNYYLLIPKLYFARRYLLFGLCVLSCFLLIEGVLTVVNRQGTPPSAQVEFSQPEPMKPPPTFSDAPPPPPPRGPVRGVQAPFPGRPREQAGLPSELSQTFILTMLGLLLALALRTNNRWRETERERLQTELSYLKAQINPHFLFNTLNSIYSLAIVESPATADALVKLSSFLRYVIQDSQKHQVALRNELDYLDQYIALQRLRLDDTVPIDYQTQGSPNGKQIAPLLLISFIENAFKYGVSPEEPSGIRVLIRIDADTLRAHVANKKVRVFQPTAVASGIGLTNTKARLKLLYPDRHELIIRDEPDSYTVDLTLTLT